MKKLFTLLAIIASTIMFAQNFNWSAQTSGVTTHLQDVFFADNQTGWAVGNAGVILHTADGGQTWAAQTSGTVINLFTVYFIDSQTGWAAGHDLSNVLLKTTDGGTTWTEIPSSSISLQIRDISFGNANNGWLTTPLGIYASTDGGTTWTLQTLSQQTTQQDVRVVSTPTDTSAFVGGFSKRNTPSNTYADVFATAESPTAAFDFLSSDQSNFKTTDNSIRCIDFPAPNIGFAGGSDGVIYKLDFGSSGNIGPWLVNLDLGIPSRLIWGISFPTVADGMFLTSSSNSNEMLVYHTSDTGSTWNMMPDTVPTEFMNALHAPDANTAWLVGDNGAIYKGAISNISIKENVLQSQVSLFPNPTNGKVTIKVNSVESTKLNYCLIDVAGRELLAGKWHKGENAQHFDLDLSDMVKGIYLLHIADDKGYTSVTRVVKQ